MQQHRSAASCALTDLSLFAVVLPLPMCFSLVRYCASSLESCLKLPYLTDKLLGMPLDLLNPSQYLRPSYVNAGALEAGDEAIMPVIKEALAAGERAQPTQLQLFQQGSSNWLRKQEFQSNNLYDVGIRSFGAAEAIDKEYLRISELKQVVKQSNSKENQIQLIEHTFESDKMSMHMERLRCERCGGRKGRACGQQNLGDLGAWPFCSTIPAPCPLLAAC